MNDLQILSLIARIEKKSRADPFKRFQHFYFIRFYLINGNGLTGWGNFEVFFSQKAYFCMCSSFSYNIFPPSFLCKLREKYEDYDL